MDYFIDTIETIPEGQGFKLLGPLHLGWVVAAVLTFILVSLYYRKLDDEKAIKFRKTIAWLIVVDELWKDFWLFVGGRFLVTYLPFHLCSINIFVILYHAYKPSKAVENYLYTVGIPGALMALFFPTWTSLPLFNFMHLHSFTIHILLILYPIMLLVRKDFRPEVNTIPKSLAILAGLGVIALCINLLLGTNFMFLMFAPEGNPLYFFYQLTGSHLVGFPVMITLLLIVMYAPIVLLNKRQKLS